MDLELVFGRKIYEQIAPVTYLNIPVLFPEATYHLNITLSQDVWKYPRWPYWPLVEVTPRARIDVVESKGIPQPGKGGWDFGDTAMFSLTCKASSLGEAVRAVYSNVYEQRRIYGSGPNMYAIRGMENG